MVLGAQLLGRGCGDGSGAPLLRSRLPHVAVRHRTTASQPISSSGGLSQRPYTSHSLTKLTFSSGMKRPGTTTSKCGKALLLRILYRDVRHTSTVHVTRINASFRNINAPFRNVLAEIGGKKKFRVLGGQTIGEVFIQKLCGIIKCPHTIGDRI